MIRVTLCTSHGSASQYTACVITNTSDDVVYCVPLFGSWMLPFGFIFILLLKENIDDAKVLS